MSVNFYISDSTNTVYADVEQTRTADTIDILGGKWQVLFGEKAFDAVIRYLELMRKQALESQKFYKELRAGGDDVQDRDVEYPIEQYEEHVEEINRFINFIGVENLKVGYR